MNTTSNTKQKPDLGLKLFILIVFIFHLFDSLYIRNHGDALNYHMYAPLNWGRFGFLHVNLFQSTHYQGAWYEWFIGLLYKAHWPQAINEREHYLILFQVISCVAAYLVVPILFYKTSKLSRQGKWLMVCAYYACEMAMFTFQFAKNDAIAMMSFLLGGFSHSPLGMMFGLGFACGIKSTYLYGSIFLIFLQYKDSQRREIFLITLGVLFFPISVWIRNYMATENWIFPLPSARGLQTSIWLKEYFYQFTKPAPQAFFIRLWELFKLTPLYLVLLLMSVGLLFKKGLKPLSKQQGLYLIAPFIYLLITGYLLEWRTFAGVLFLAVFNLVLFFDMNWSYKRNIIFVFLCALGLSSSKIDFSSIRRFNSGRTKNFSDLTRDGKTFLRANELLGPNDIMLTHLTNEGFFLVPQIYTLNEHPSREEILKKFPILEGYSYFIGIQTDGKCLGEKDNLNFVKPLLEKSQSDLVHDDKVTELYWLKLNCGEPTS